jgi:hypothetical protein
MGAAAGGMSAARRGSTIRSSFAAGLVLQDLGRAHSIADDGKSDATKPVGANRFISRLDKRLKISLMLFKLVQRRFFVLN